MVLNIKKGEKKRKEHRLHTYCNLKKVYIIKKEEALHIMN